MVFQASGLPLCAIPRRAKYEPKSTENDAGMQSLLAAVEPDLSNRRGLDYTSHSTLHSSFVDCPDHRKVMADLLETNFDEAQLSPLSDAQLAARSFETCPSGTTPESEQSIMEYPFSATYDNFQSSPAQTYVRRTWSGLREEYKDAEVRRSRIRSVVQHDLSTLTTKDAKFSESSRFTKITFAWPLVAPKSYGTERRLLTPAPMCKISGRYQGLCGQKAKAHLLICPDDQSIAVGVPHTLKFDDTLRAVYKSLHLNKDVFGRSKTVQLKVQIAQIGLPYPFDIPLVEFESPDIVLLTKPSKRMSRIKMQTSLIHAGDCVSLYNRVNAQTLSTKYLTVEKNGTCVQANTWTSFQIYPIQEENQQLDTTYRPLLYDMTVVLSDPSTGYVSPPMIVRRLDGKFISEDSSSSISQMQRMCFERPPLDSISSDVLPPARRAFLSASLAQSKNAPTETAIQFTTFEDYLPRSSDSGVIEIDDFGQWTIVGVGSAEFSFLDTLSELDGLTLPSATLHTHVAQDPAQHVKRKLSDLDGPYPSVVDTGVPSTSVVSTTVEQAGATDLPVRPSTTQSSPQPLAASPPTRPLSYLGIQTPLTPFPTLLSPPSYHSSSKLHLSVRDYHQPSSLLADPEIWLSTYGPCPIVSINPIVGFPSDALIEVTVPDLQELEKFSIRPGDTLVVLFVREDGLVVKGGAQFVINEHGGLS